MSEAVNSADLVPAWIGAIATSVGAVVAIVAIILTYLQVRLTAAQMRETARREAQNSEDQTRPYVGLDVVPSLAGSPAFDLVISNFGRTAARDLVLSIDGNGFGPQSEGDLIGPALGKLFGMPFDLAPGARRRVFWHMPADERSEPSGDLGTPVAAELRMSYGWEPGGGQQERRYDERLRYDLSEYPNLTPIPAQGAKANGAEADPTVQMRNVVHVLGAIASHVGELRR